MKLKKHAKIIAIISVLIFVVAMIDVFNGDKHMRIVPYCIISLLILWIIQKIIDYAESYKE